MVSAGYKRLKRFRERRRNGKVVVRIEIDLSAVGLWLSESGFLAAWDDHDPRRISEALQCAVEVWSRQ